MDSCHLQTWVVSGQSRDQQELLEGLKKGTALYVEGAFRVWLKESQVGPAGKETMFRQY